MKSHRIAGLVLLASLWGCQKLEIRSNTRPNYAPKVERLAIQVTYPSEEDLTFAQTDREGLSEALQAQGILGFVQLPNPETAKADAAFLMENVNPAPSHLLRISIIHRGVRFFTKGSVGVGYTANVQLALSEAEKGLVVWKGELWISGAANSKESIRSMATQVFQELQQKGLLKSSAKS